MNNKRAFNLFVLAFILLLSVFLPSFIISKSKDTGDTKPPNPYKTKEKIEQEEEFDIPELLDENGETKKMDLSSLDDQSEISDLEEKKKENIQFKPTDPIYFNDPADNEWKLYIFSLYEVVMIIFLILYIISCMSGVNTNQGLVTKWFSNNKQFFIDNYAHIGMEPQYDISQNSIQKESYNNYKFYASGRKHLNFTLVSIDLVKRQDMISQISSFFLPDEKDRIIYDLSLNASQIPHIFCICRKKDIKYMKKTYADIDIIAKKYEPDYISSSLVLMSEDDEISDKIFSDRNLKNLWEKIENLVDIIYFTDRQTYTKEQHSLFCSFYVTNMKNSLLITQFVHALVDRLTYLEFSASKKKAGEKARAEYEE